MHLQLGPHVNLSKSDVLGMLFWYQHWKHGWNYGSDRRGGDCTKIYFLYQFIPQDHDPDGGELARMATMDFSEPRIVEIPSSNNPVDMTDLRLGLAFQLDVKGKIRDSRRVLRMVKHRLQGVLNSVYPEFFRQLSQKSGL